MMTSLLLNVQFQPDHRAGLSHQLVETAGFTSPNAITTSKNSALVTSG